jgi:hypothetical protein
MAYSQDSKPAQKSFLRRLVGSMCFASLSVSQKQFLGPLLLIQVLSMLSSLLKVQASNKQLGPLIGIATPLADRSAWRVRPEDNRPELRRRSSYLLRTTWSAGHTGRDRIAGSA